MAFYKMSYTEDSFQPRSIYHPLPVCMFQPGVLHLI